MNIDENNMMVRFAGTGNLGQQKPADLLVHGLRSNHSAVASAVAAKFSSMKPRLRNSGISQPSKISWRRRFMFMVARPMLRESAALTC
jgi:hypothetical protein